MSFRSRYALFAICLLVAAVCTRLGFWQLSRLQERRAANQVAGTLRAGPLLDLNRGGPAAPRADRRVTVTGVYDREHEIVLRSFVHREVPGVQVVTPLRIEGSDSAVLVNRGFVPAADAIVAATDPLAEPGTLRVQGVAFLIPVSEDSGRRLITRGRVTWRRLDLLELRRRIPYPLLDVYILQQPDTALPLYPRRLEAPALDDGPHLSYALQWFGFATIAIAGGVIFVLRRRP